MIRHSAGAITIMIGAVLAPLVIALFMNASSLEKVQQALLEYSIPSQMGVFYDNTLSHSGPSGWEPLWIILGVTAAAFAGAYALLEPAGRLTPPAAPSEPGPVAGPPYPRGAAVPCVPARLVPVPPVVDARVLRPGHHVRDTGGDHPGRSRGSGSVLPSALAPATWRTLHSSPCQLSVDCQPPYRPDRSSSAPRPDESAVFGRLRRGDTGHLSGLYRERGPRPAYAAPAGVRVGHQPVQVPFQADPFQQRSDHSADNPQIPPPKPCPGHVSCGYAGRGSSRSEPRKREMRCA